MLGNHLPRQCGIATFTTDLTDAIATALPDLDCFVLAMNDAGDGTCTRRASASRSPRATSAPIGARPTS